MAAVDFFLKLDGIDGESVDANHKGEIEVESFSFGLSNTGRAAAGGGGGAGKASFEDFHFTALSSKASPKLFLACASGQHIKSAILTGRAAGKAQLEFVKIELTDLLVSSYHDAGTRDAVPAEDFTLNFGSVKYSYRSSQPDGTLAEPLSIGWNLSSQKLA